MIFLPVQTAILKYLYDNDVPEGTDVGKIRSEMVENCNQAQLLKPGLLKEYFMVLHLNGLVEASGYVLSEKDKLCICFAITPKGRQTVENYVLGRDGG
jgi:hypothetical protein